MAAMVVLLWLGSAAAPTTASSAGTEPVRFGILPMGSAAESVTQWRPLLDDLEAHLGRQVTTVSVSSYSGLSHAIGAQRVDVAFLSGRLAVEAVRHQHMRVFAQFLRSDGASGNIAMLVVRTDSTIGSVKQLLATMRRWRYGRGERLSVTGYIAPEAYVFAPAGKNSDTDFASVHVGGHQANLLELVNRNVDVVSSNSPDMDLFTHNFPGEAAQLRVLWQSAPIPSGVMVVSEGMDKTLQQRLAEFLLGYGHAAGDRGVREREKLARIPDLGGFISQTNAVLRPMVDMQYTLIRQQAEHGQWISPGAKQAKLKQIEREYAADLRGFTGD